MIIVETDWSGLDKNLAVMEMAPSKKGVAALDATLAFGLATEKAATHVETGSLESSEKTDSSLKGAQWESEIAAGGASTGIHNPVDYAIYEQARGGPHDFLASLDALDPFWIGAVEEGFTE